MMRIGAAVASVAAMSRLARADTPIVAPINSRDYAIELYDNVATGASQEIAMGGAAVANATSSEGTLVNVSAPAVRATTDTGRWGLGVHLDVFDTSLSNDTENSGLASAGANGAVAAVTAGLALRVGDWAGAATVTYESVQIGDTQGSGAATQLYGETTRVQFALARWLPQLDLAIGAALDVGAFSLVSGCALCTTLFSINGTGLEAGATWIPHDQPFRFGANAQTGLRGGNVTASCFTDTHPTSCDGYTLPDEVVAPWQLAVGGAYRFGPTAWNQLVKTPFRDERAITVVADLVVIGSTTGAYGLDAFGLHELQRAGEHPAYSARGGVEYEAFPGRLRLRAGTYWEPGLLAGVGGREHATFGFELRLFEFHAWGPRRIQLTTTGDVADNYENLSLGVGFW